MTEGRWADEARTLVLNGLADVAGAGPSVHHDDEDREFLRSVYADATTAAERDAFETAVGTVDRAADAASGEPGGPDEQLLSVVDAVLEDLDARDVGLVVEHAARGSFSPRDAALYTYVTTGDGAALDDLALPDDVRAAVDAGVEHADAGEFEAAAEAFERGREGAPVTARVLAAWAHHRAGADSRAVDAVREALREDADAWSARAVGLAADHASPGRFRDGDLAALVYVRARVETPGDSRVEIRVDDAATGERLDRAEEGDRSCRPVRRLPPEVTLRVTSRGTPAAMPSVHAYYVALGAVETAGMVPKTVEHTLLDGPVTADATETLRYARPDDQ